METSQSMVCEWRGKPPRIHVGQSRRRASISTTNNEAEPCNLEPTHYSRTKGPIKALADMPAEQPSAEVRRRAAREVIDILHEIATLLVRSPRNHPCHASDSPQNTHLDRQQLSYCVSLIENGANPEALAVGPRHSYRPFILRHSSFTTPTRAV